MEIVDELGSRDLGLGRPVARVPLLLALAIAVDADINDDVPDCPCERACGCVPASVPPQPVEKRRYWNEETAPEPAGWEFTAAGRLVGCGATEADDLGGLLDRDRRLAGELIEG